MAASAGHPDLEGRALAQIPRGATLSGSTIVAIEPVPYTGARTRDVLPSGTTDAYWAEGVALQSSFAGRH